MKNRIPTLLILLSVCLSASAQKHKDHTASICNCHRANLGISTHDIRLYECLQDFNDSVFNFINDYGISNNSDWEVMTGMGAFCIMVPPQDSLKLDKLVRQAIRDGKLDAKRYIPVWNSTRETMAYVGGAERSFSLLCFGRAKVVEGSRGDRHAVAVMDGSVIDKAEVEESATEKHKYVAHLTLNKEGAKQFGQFSKRNMGKRIVFAIGDGHGIVIEVMSVIESGRLSVWGLTLEDACALADAVNKLH